MIELLWAVIVKKEEIVNDRCVLTEPVQATTIPISQREQLKAEGRSVLPIKLPKMFAVLALYGGVPGQKFNLSGSIVSPEGKPSYLPVQERAWRDKPSLRLNVAIDGHLPFKNSGVFKFNFLLDGRPLVSLPLPIYWEGDWPNNI